MSAERIDPETLAAFLEGKLAPDDRVRVLRVLAEHPEEFEAFADAARITAELEAEAARVVPIGRDRSAGRRWMVGVPLLLAAGIAAVVVLPRLGGGGGLSPADLAGRLSLVSQPGSGSLAMRLGPNWDQPGWSVTRGGGADVVEPARAFRLGARATDVEIAVRAQDTLALRLVGGELIQLVGAVDAGAPAAALYQRIVNAGVAGPARDRKAAAQAVRALMGDSPWFDLGVWTEAARVAVAAGEVGFVQEYGSEITKLIARLETKPPEESGLVIESLKQLQTRLGSGDVETLKAELGRVIVAAGK